MNKLSDNVHEVPLEDLLMVADDTNCHIGSTCDGFEDVIGCFSFGVRNLEGENMLVAQPVMSYELIIIIERGWNMHIKVGEMKVRLIMCRRHEKLRMKNCNVILCKARHA